MQQPKAMSITEVITASYICNVRIKFREVQQPLLWGGKWGIKHLDAIQAMVKLTVAYI
jgi:hypothetical protein